MDAPSPELLKRLNELGLASEREIRNCRRYVGQIARDLPLFDSVWLDALVRARALTPFQARALERSDGQSIRAGRWLLVDRIDSDGFPELFRAQIPGESGRRMLSRCRLPAGEGSRRLSRLVEAVERLGTVRSGGLRCPSECGQDESGLFIVSDECAGATLHDILVRRGRFDGTLVAEIARLLLKALAILHSAGEIHGDMRLRNVWLDSGKRRGSVAIANPALAAVVRPQISIHDEWPLDSLDVAAPEAIGPQGTRTPRGDLYSLGCLLWQLLAGRPPHPTADPIAKLIAHQKRDIADIRVWAPETPAALVDLIGGLVERDPTRRPEGADAALDRFGKTLRAKASRRRANWPAADSRPTRAARGSSTLRSAGLAVCCVVGLGTVIGLIKKSDRAPETLSLPSPGPESPDAPVERDERRAWPKPRDGQIVLDHAGPWKAAKISAVGPLMIRGAAGIRPIVEIENEPLEVWGERVLISGVDFRRKAATGSEPGDGTTGALLAVGAQLVQIQECRFDGPPEGNGPGSPPVAIRWSLIDDSASAEARILVKNSALLGPLRGVEVPAGHGNVAISNVLKSGSGELLTMAAGRSAGPASRTIHLRGTTLRGECPLLQVAADTQTRWKIAADHAVFGTVDAALVEFRTEHPPAGWERSIEFEGQSTVVSLGTPFVAGRDSLGSLVPWPSEKVRIDGIQFDDLQFAGEPSEPWNAQRLTGLTIPLPDETLPGIGTSPF